MKIFVRTAALCLTALMVVVSTLPTGAAEPLSPALTLLSAEASMAKAGLISEEISFSADDFARALNRSSVKAITVATLPPAAEGKLKLGSVDVYAGQVIARNSLNLLRFIPAADAVTESSFTFSTDGSGYALTCALYLLPALNFAPTVELADDNALTVSTHRAISCFGSLPAYDPEGDPLTYEIVSAPKKGSVILTDAANGDYRYTPAEGKTGRDSFRYVVHDKYGNYSAAATVSITITRPKTAMVFADMDGHWAHNAALTMAEEGLMQGRQIGNTVCFSPDETVSRGEFLVMAMHAAGITNVPAAQTTGFADDDAIPTAMKGYVATAVRMGYIQGRAAEGQKLFCPDDPITRAEAAVMLGNMLDAAVPTVKPVFRDADGVPEWAYDALSALNALGVMSGTGSGIIAANVTLTRAQAAQILCAVMALN